MQRQIQDLEKWGRGWVKVPIFHCDGITFALEIPTCWKTLKFPLPPTRTLKFALPPTRNPNASQWNIGCVGSPGVGAHVGHVHVVSDNFVCIG